MPRRAAPLGAEQTVAKGVRRAGLPMALVVERTSAPARTERLPRARDTPSRVDAPRLRDFRGSGQRVGAYLIRHRVVVRVRKCSTTLSISSHRWPGAVARDRGLDRLDRSSADGFIEAGGKNIGQLFVQKRGFFVRLIVQHA